MAEFPTDRGQNVDGHFIGGYKKAQTSGNGALMIGDEEIASGAEFEYGESTAAKRARKKASEAEAIAPHQVIGELLEPAPQVLIRGEPRVRKTEDVSEVLKYLFREEAHFIQKPGKSPVITIIHEGDYTLVILSETGWKDLANAVMYMAAEMEEKTRIGEQWEALRKLPTVGSMLELLE